MLRHTTFQFASIETPKATILTFSGALDESAHLPPLQETRANVVLVNMRKVSAINSAGIRNWVNWVGRVQAPKQLWLEECPVVFVRNLGLVKGLLNANVKIVSFYIPFYSEKTGERADLLVRDGHEYGAGHALKFNPPNDKNGEPMEMDVLPESYLAFLPE